MQDNVAIILLNWNSFKDTYDCVESLKKMIHSQFHIFIIDNDSMDNSWNLLNDVFSTDSTITLIKSPENIGFAGGNNIGIKAALKMGYNYFWLLNVDTIVKEDTLSELLLALKKDNKIGITGSKILYFGTNKIWFAGGKVNLFTGKVGHVGMGKEDIYNQFNIEKDSQYITGCSLLVQRKVLDTVGLMKEDYFLYYEETDWNIRIRKAGWKTVYVPKSVVFHKVSTSSGGEKNPSPFVSYYTVRNAFALIKNTQPSYRIFTAFFFLILKFLYKLVLVFIKRQNRKKERVWYIFKALKDSFEFKMGKHPIYNKSNFQ